jgi:hypothetical protein
MFGIYEINEVNDQFELAVDHAAATMSELFWVSPPTTRQEVVDTQSID